MTRSEEHTSELQSRVDLVCRLLLEKKKQGRMWLPPTSVSCSGIPGRAETTAGRCSPLFFFFNDTPTTESYTLSLHDALPICSQRQVAESEAEAQRIKTTAEVESLRL